jgi:hypothetical protein
MALNQRDLLAATGLARGRIEEAETTHKNLKTIPNGFHTSSIGDTIIF